MTDREAPIPFWKLKTLSQMTQEEWESLCDGCGQCCLHKVEDADTGEIGLTDVACSLLDLHGCNCKDYTNRKSQVPDCVQLTPGRAPTLRWLPQTCGYRLLANGKDLEWWHPLVSGNPDSVHEAGISVRDKAVSEENVKNLEQHIVDWLVDGAEPFHRRKFGGRGRRR